MKPIVLIAILTTVALSAMSFHTSALADDTSEPTRRDAEQPKDNTRHDNSLTEKCNSLLDEDDDTAKKAKATPKSSPQTKSQGQQPETKSSKIPPAQPLAKKDDKPTPTQAGAVDEGDVTTDTQKHKNSSTGISSPIATQTDTPKDTSAVAKQITKTITGMILINQKGNSIEASIQSENNGNLRVPTEYASNFASFGGKSKKILCAVGPDGKLIPQSVVAKKDDSTKKK